MRKYRAENPDKHREQSRNNKAKLREKLLNMYGWECAICKFADTRALTLDHIAQNGNVERKELGGRASEACIIESFKPDEYRILCMNCQFIERHSHDWKNRPAVVARAWRELAA